MNYYSLRYLDLNDPLYFFSIVLFVFALLLSIYAQIKVKGAFNKYSKVYCSLTGAEAAERMLRAANVYSVKIERISGNLTDNFDPRTNVIHLSDNVYDIHSVAAVGIACHEAGHAIQYAQGYAPIKFRNAIIPVTNIGSRLAVPLILLGMILSLPFLSLAGAVLFGLAVFFQLVTLPVEFNASHRAVVKIKEAYLLKNDEDIKAVKKVLTAAALTYVAALLLALAQFLRLIALTNRRR